MQRSPVGISVSSGRRGGQGVIWRKMPTADGGHFDQFAEAIKAIQTNPNSRRIIVNAWRPDRFDRMALPPCHVLSQYVLDVKKNEMHMNMYIRSNDLFLGLPSNVVQYAWLLCAVAHATGYTPRMLTYFVGDGHLYRDSHQATREQLEREPRALPKLVFNKPYDGSVSVLEWLENLHPDDFALEGYDPHPPLTSPMPKMAV